MKIRSSQLLSKGLGIIFDSSLSFPPYIQSVNESNGTTSKYMWNQMLLVPSTGQSDHPITFELPHKHPNFIWLGTYS